MMAVVQRVSDASVVVDGNVVGLIGRGLLIFLGVRKDDLPHNARELAAKVVKLRIFQDGGGKMNESVLDVGGEILVVSQFTLYGATDKGHRPSFSLAALAAQARVLYEQFVEECRKSGLHVATGMFQADMKVNLTNDGPVTLLCRSENE